MLNSIILSIGAIILHLGSLAYALAFFAAFAETIIGIGLITPGSTILLFLGGFAAAGNLNFFDLMFFATAGAIIGDNINYFLGKRFGKKWTKDGLWFIKPAHFELGNKFFNRHGGKSVFLGRFIPMLKEITPFISGSMKMKYFHFFIYNSLGSIGWAFEFLGLGFLFSGSIILAEAWLGNIAFFVFLIILFFIVLSITQLIIVKFGKEILRLGKSYFNEISKWLLGKEEAKKWVKKHPKTIIFLLKRFSNNSFWGLYFTIFSFLFLYVLLSFIGIINGIMFGGILIQIDERLTHIFYYYRDPTLISIFLWITFLGKASVVIIFSGITTLILWITKKKNEIIPLLFSVVGASGSVVLLKYIFHRPRPELSVYVESAFSFPSGHSAIAVGFYGFLAWLFFKYLNKWEHKISTVIYFILLIFLIGLSRLYLNVHYLSDVLGGFLLGAMILIISIAISTFSSFKLPPNSLEKNTINKKIIILSWIVFGILFFIFIANHYQKELIFKTNSRPQTQNINNVIDVFDTPHLKFTETIVGRETEPVNFVFLAKNKDSLKEIFISAGWTPSEGLGIKSIAKMMDNVFGTRAYNEAPITPLFWNAKVQDMSFEKLPDSKNLKIRHHIRIWDTNKMTREKQIFVGTAVFDDGLKWGLLHKISPMIDEERELLFSDLNETKEIKDFEKIENIPPYEGLNFSNDNFFTDGQIYVIKF